MICSPSKHNCMENDSKNDDVNKRGADATADMVQGEGSLGVDIGIQENALPEGTRDLSGVSSARHDGDNQDPCVEKLEIKEQEQKLTIKTGRVTEKILKKPVKTNLKVNERSDSRGSSASVPQTFGPTLNKGCTSGASNTDVHQPPRVLTSTQLVPSATVNGGSRVKSDTAKASGAHSSVGSLSRQTNIRKSHSNFTVPQPFALATDKRASSAGQLLSTGRSFNAQMLKEGDQKTNRGKEDAKHSEAVKVELTKEHLRASGNTFNFNSDVRAVRRKEFNSKMEERLTAKEVEKTQAQAKTKEDVQAEIRRFRKSLTFIATPMPTFYQDTAPPKLEIKKIPPTRAKSPKLGRRNGSATSQAKHEPKDLSLFHPTHTDQNSAENSGQIKALRSSAQSASGKKRVSSLPNMPLKQVSGPNTSRPKDPSIMINPDHVVSVAECEIDKLMSPVHGDEANIHVQVGDQVETAVLSNVLEEAVHT